jgi:hypothetical protein
VNTLLDFNTSLKKKQVNGQPVFDPMAGDNVSPKGSGNNNVSWNLSVELLHTEVEQK